VEKQYIWFDTGLGCLAAVLGFAAASVSIVLIFPFISASPWLFVVASLALLLVFMWLPFRIDARTKMRLRVKNSVPESGDLSDRDICKNSKTLQ